MFAPSLLKVNPNKTRMYKLFAKFVTIALYTAIIFAVSGYANINNNLKNDLSVQVDKLIKTEFKSNAVMSDSIIGSWGGKHISVEITGQGANIEFDCAHAKINEKITLDKRNRFDASGTYVEERGGPIRLNEKSNGFAAKFIGQIKGKQMTLTIKRKDNNKIIGTFTLIRGEEPFLVKCR
jgi:hypothetical protein